MIIFMIVTAVVFLQFIGVPIYRLYGPMFTLH